MAMCAHCHTDKPMASPVCPNCNHSTPLFGSLAEGGQLIFSILFPLFTLGWFVLAFWLFITIF